MGTKTNNNPATVSEPKSSAVVGKVNSWFKKSYGITPLKRDTAVAVQAYYGLRELLGLKFQSELGLRKSRKRFDWGKWNGQTFAAIAGQPLKPKLSDDEMAELAIAYLPEISGETTETVIAQLAAFNQHSQSERNKARLLANNIGSATVPAADEDDDDIFDDDDDEEMDDITDDEDDDDFDEDDE